MITHTNLFHTTELQRILKINKEVDKILSIVSFGQQIKMGKLVSSIVFNATFNNISAISLWSVLLVEETRGPGENHRLVASH